jgi:hypothetical protein
MQEAETAYTVPEYLNFLAVRNISKYFITKEKIRWSDENVISDFSQTMLSWTTIALFIYWLIVVLRSKSSISAIFRLQYAYTFCGIYKMKQF